MDAKAKKYGLIIYPSNRKLKKYMFIHNGKTVHFGDSRYDDFSMTGDEARRRAFRQRNRRFAQAPMYTPAWASWTLSW